MFCVLFCFVDFSSPRTANVETNCLQSWCVPTRACCHLFALSDTCLCRVFCVSAVCWKANEPITIEDVEVAPPKAHEVRVRLTAAHICHTGVSVLGRPLLLWFGSRLDRCWPTDSLVLEGLDSEGVYPVILGHEGAGIVESVGEGVTSCKVGDHVIPCYIPECGQCKFCKSGKTNLCQKIRTTQGKGLMPDGTSRFTCKGQPVFHFMGCSTFSEYTVLADISVAVIRRDVPLDKVGVFVFKLTFISFIRIHHSK